MSSINDKFSSIIKKVDAVYKDTRVSEFQYQQEELLKDWRQNYIRYLLLRESLDKVKEKIDYYTSGLNGDKLLYFSLFMDLLGATGGVLESLLCVGTLFTGGLLGIIIALVFVVFIIVKTIFDRYFSK